MNFPALCFFLHLASLHDLIFLSRSKVKAQGGEKEVASCFFALLNSGLKLVKSTFLFSMRKITFFASENDP